MKTVRLFKENVYLRECEACGASETEYTDKLEHEYGKTIVVTPSTCLEEGEGVRYCVNCGGSITERLPLASHEYESETVLPSCTESGYTLHRCIWCNDEYTDDETQALGHSYGEWETVSPAECESVGEVRPNALRKTAGGLRDRIGCGVGGRAARRPRRRPERRGGPARSHASPNRVGIGTLIPEFFESRKRKTLFDAASTIGSCGLIE